MQRNSTPDYSVGYSRPPKHSQFKKGRSGNPRGRPKGSRNFSTLVKNELKEPVIVNEHGRRKQLTKTEVIAKQVVNKAVAADPRALRFLIDQGLLEVGPEAAPELLPDQKAGLPLFVETCRTLIELGCISIEQLTHGLRKGASGPPAQQPGAPSDPGRTNR